MSSFPALTPKEIIKILEKLGYQFYRSKGSHRIYVKDDRLAIVPYHSKSLKTGTQKSIIKNTGLTEEEFFLHR